MSAVKYGVAATLVAFAFAGPANAGHTGSTKITINENGGVFSGEVRTYRPPCAPNRRVILRKVRPGKDLKIATDITDSGGKWKIDTNRTNGKYYAKLKANNNCEGAKSGTIKI